MWPENVVRLSHTKPNVEQILTFAGPLNYVMHSQTVQIVYQCAKVPFEVFIFYTCTLVTLQTHNEMFLNVGKPAAWNLRENSIHFMHFLIHFEIHRAKKLET